MKEFTKKGLIKVGYAATVFGWISTIAVMNIQKEKEIELVRMENVAPIEFVSILEPMVIEKEIIVEKEVIQYVDVPMAIEEDEESIPAAAEPQSADINTQYIDGGFNVFEPSNVSEDQLIDALGDTRSTFHEVAGAIVDAEQIYGVNALYLASTLGLESGWNRHQSGYNNIAGFKDPHSESGWKNFDSIYDCVMLVAEELASIWKPAVGESLSGITGRYCPEPDYMSKIMSIMTTLQNNLY